MAASNDNNSIDDIQWVNGRQYISPESFVRLWQTSETVCHIRHRVATWVAATNWLTHRLKEAKVDLAESVLRLDAFKRKDTDSDHLTQKDVAALTGKKWRRWAYSTNACATVDVDEQQAIIGHFVAKDQERVELAQFAVDNPIHSRYIPTTASLQSRAYRYREEKCVPLKRLPLDNEAQTNTQDKWEALAVLAKELIAA